VEVLLRRELSARYRGMMLGYVWSLLNPLLMLSIYVVIFRWGLGVDRQNTHYISDLMLGLFPWWAIQQGTQEAVQVYIHQANFIKKVYLPLAILPCVVISLHWIQLCLTFPLVFLGLWYEGVAPHVGWLCLPALLLAQWLFSFGLGLLFAVLAVEFRDLVHIVQHMMSILFYATPILYRLEYMPKPIANVIALNPIAWLIQAYRSLLNHSDGLWRVDFFKFFVVALLLSGVAVWVYQQRRYRIPELV
jgi:ABC-type polysaccharide/polyol phosphate export permease